jgi:hypothetical protein
VEVVPVPQHDRVFGVLMWCGGFQFSNQGSRGAYLALLFTQIPITTESVKPFALLPAILLGCLAFLPDCAFAGSATWSSEPESFDWNTPTNWTPPTVPDGPSDVATFANSSQTMVEIPGATEVDGIVFQPGADAFTLIQQFGDFGDNTFIFSGEGVVNDSGLMQNFVASATPYGTEFFFYNTASAGALTHFRLETSDTSATALEFRDSSSAASATILNEGGGQISGGGSGTLFFDTSNGSEC